MALLGTACPEAPEDDDGGQGDDDTVVEEGEDGCVRINEVETVGFYYIQDAVDAAVDGDVVSLCNRTYLEAVVIDKAITLIPRVDVVGTPTIQGIGGEPAITIRGVPATQTPTQVLGVAALGDDAGIHVQDSSGVVIDGVVANDGGPWGVRVTASQVDVVGTTFSGNSEGGLDVAAASTVTVDGSFFRGAGEFGVFASASALTVTGSEFSGIVRPDGADAASAAGSGVYAEALSAPLSVNLSEFNDGWAGVVMTGGELDVADSTFNRMDYGVVHGGGATRTSVTGSTLQSLRAIGLDLEGAATVEGCSISASDSGDVAVGIAAVPGSGDLSLVGNVLSGLGGGCVWIGDGGARATGAIDLQQNALSECVGVAVAVENATTFAMSLDSITGVAFGATADEDAGVGIRVEDVGDATLDGVSVGGTSGYGVLVDASEASLDASSVSAAGLGGVALRGGAELDATGTRLEANLGRGVLVDDGSDLVMTGCDIVSTLGRLDPIGGVDYIAGAAVEARDGSTATLVGSTLDDNAQGVDADESLVSVGTTTITAQVGTALHARSSGVDDSLWLTATDVTVVGGDRALFAEGIPTAVSGLTVDDTRGDAIVVDGVSQTTLEDVDVSDAGARGVVVSSADVVTLSMVTVRYSHGAGVVVSGSAYVTGNDVRVTGAVDAGVNIQSSQTVSLDGVDVDGTSGDGVAVSSSTGVALLDLNVSGSTAEGIYASASTGVTIGGGSQSRDNLGNGLKVPSSEVTLDGFTASQNDGDGLYVSSASTVSGSGCVLSGNIGYGLRASESAVTLTGSAVDGNTSGGISADGGTLAVTSNTGVSNNGGNGIRVGGALTGSVTDTPITANGGFGIACQGASVVLAPCHNVMSANVSGDFAELGGCDLICTVD